MISDEEVLKKWVHGEDGVRIILYGHYRITYIIKSEDEVDIIGVFHGALEMERYLK